MSIETGSSKYSSPVPSYLSAPSGITFLKADVERRSLLFPTRPNSISLSFSARGVTRLANFSTASW
jgi:hypothetical protein